MRMKEGKGEGIGSEEKEMSEDDGRKKKRQGERGR